MSDNLSNYDHIHEKFKEYSLWIKEKNKELLTSFQKENKWTQLAWETTALEFFFAKLPLISIPAVILDVGGSFGNLFQKFYYDNVKFSDITGMASSLASVVGTFSMAASLGIEATLIGTRLVTIANLTTPVGIGLLALGYAVDHRAEIKEYIKKEYALFKGEYGLASINFLEAKETLLFNMEVPLTKINLDKLFSYDSEKFKSYGMDNINSIIEPDLEKLVNIDHSNILNKQYEVTQEPDLSFNPFLTEIEVTQPTPLEISQELFLSIDMSDSNLELIHLTKDDLRNSPLYTRTTGHPITTYRNDDLPWLHKGSHFMEVNDKFYLYDGIGINKGIPFPLLYDKITKLPLGLPMDVSGNFIEKNTLDVLKHSPELFDDPGHVYNNMAIQRNLLHKTAIQSSIQLNHLSNNAIQNRIQELQVIKNKDVLKIKNDEIKGLNENIKQNGQTATLSPISGNSREGKYCVRSDDSDESDMMDPNANNQKIVVEVCFDINQFVFE